MTVAAKTGRFTANKTGKDQFFGRDSDEMWQKRGFVSRRNSTLLRLASESGQLITRESSMTKRPIGSLK